MHPCVHLSFCLSIRRINIRQYWPRISITCGWFPSGLDWLLPGWAHEIQLIKWWCNDNDFKALQDCLEEKPYKKRTSTMAMKGPHLCRGKMSGHKHWKIAGSTAFSGPAPCQTASTRGRTCVSSGHRPGMVRLKTCLQQPTTFMVKNGLTYVNYIMVDKLVNNKIV